jgi:hypothetical protein
MEAGGGVEVSTYEIKWREELLFAMAVFAVYVLGEFLLTGDAPPANWQEWAIATAMAGARMAVAVMIRPFVAIISARNSNGT